MSNANCYICGVETNATVEEVEAAMQEAKAIMGENYECMATCAMCASRMTMALRLSQAFGFPFDMKGTADIFRAMAEAEKAGGSSRRVLIEQIWATVKRLDTGEINYTGDPVLVEHDPWSNDKLVFERKIYDGTVVIECEGVIVERLCNLQ